MPLAALPPPKAAERVVWLSQPSADDIARAEGFFAPTNATTAKSAMTCFVLADGRLDACKVDRDAGDRRYAEAMLALKDRYRLDRDASSPRAQITVAATFPKLVDVDPRLVAQPTAAEAQAAIPGADDAVVELRCKVALSGELKDCDAHGEKDNARFEAAALGLVAKFRFQPATLAGRPTERYGVVRVAASSHVVTNPDWARKPNGDDFAAVYPQIAIASGLGGWARMKCDVTSEGALADCLVLEESPRGIGFGDAVLKMASKFRMRPKTLDGKPVAGATVVIPVNFVVPGGARKVDVNTPGSFKVLPWAPWIAAPTPADVAAAFPKRALDAKAFGNAAIRCELKRDGSLVACESAVDGPDPMGFGRAAISLAPKFRANLEGMKLRRLGDFRVAVSVSFSDRALKSAEERYVRQPEWVRAPDARTVLNAYPDKAVQAGVLSGKAVVECRIGVGGALEACSAKSQEPEGLDFGLSGEKVASIMQANLWTRDGEAAVGQRVMLPLRFIYSGTPPAAAPAPAAGKPGG